MVLLVLCPGTHGTAACIPCMTILPCIYPSLFMFPSVSKPRVSRQLAVTTASGAAARWHQCSPVSIPGGWGCHWATRSWCPVQAPPRPQVWRAGGHILLCTRAERVLKGCGWPLSITILANAFLPLTKRLTGVGNNTFCATWHVVWGLVKRPSPSKSVGLFLLISLEL